MSSVRLAARELENTLREARLACDRAFSEWRDRRADEARRELIDPLVADVRRYVADVEQAAAGVDRAERRLSR